MWTWRLARLGLGRVSEQRQDDHLWRLNSGMRGWCKRASPLSVHVSFRTRMPDDASATVSLSWILHRSCPPAYVIPATRWRQVEVAFLTSASAFWVSILWEGQVEGPRRSRPAEVSFKAAGHPLMTQGPERPL